MSFSKELTGGFNGAWRLMVSAKMILRSVGPAVAIGCVALSGCDPEWAKEMEFGTNVPDARILVELGQSSSPPELYEKFEELARLAGYAVRIGIDPEKFDENMLPVYDEWAESLHGRFHGYTVSFFAPRNEATPSQFTVVFRNSSTDRFTETEWREFERWRRIFVPNVFPDAKLSTIKHPAANTSKEELARIISETELEAPR